MRECLTHKSHDFQYSGTWDWHANISQWLLQSWELPIVFPVFNVFVINHWSADTESRVSWVSGPRSGSGNLAPPSVGVHYTTLHNAQIWNTRTLTFNRENLLYIFPSRECLRLGKCMYVDQSPNLKWISKNLHSLICSFDYPQSYIN